MQLHTAQCVMCASILLLPLYHGIQVLQCKRFYGQRHQGPLKSKEGHSTQIFISFHPRPNQTETNFTQGRSDFCGSSWCCQRGRGRILIPIIKFRDLQYINFKSRIPHELKQLKYLKVMDKNGWNKKNLYKCNSNDFKKSESKIRQRGMLL